jgi:acyl-CoA thioesterase
MGLYDNAQLVRTGEGTYFGQTDPAYWNLIGPFGGWIAAVLMHAVLSEKETIGTPLSLSLNFAGAMEPGAFAVRLRQLRHNRSTTFWSAELTQTQNETNVLCAFATMVTARRRETAGFLEVVMPKVDPPDGWTRFAPPGILPFLQKLDMRFGAHKIFPSVIDGATVTYMRAVDTTVFDFETLAALCDAGIPQIFMRLKRRVPVSSVTLNVFFYADEAELDTVGTDFVLNATRMRRAARGFFDASAQLWSRAGALLATTEQIVWFRDTQ